MPEETQRKEEEINSQELTVLEKAEMLAKKLDEQNKKSEELLKKQEEILTRQLLGGKSDAGSKPKEMTEEERINLAAKKYMDIMKNG